MDVKKECQNNSISVHDKFFILALLIDRIQISEW
jgi:hypothetical protein